MVRDPLGVVRTLAGHEAAWGIKASVLKWRGRKWGYGNPRTWERVHHVIVRDPEGVARSVRQHARHHAIKRGTLSSRAYRKGWWNPAVWDTVHPGDLTPDEEAAGEELRRLLLGP